MGIIIQTKRLILRTWQDSDAQAYYEMNQDPKVIQYFLGALTMTQVTDFIKAKNQQQQELGYTLWAVELKSTGEFIGFIGLNYTQWPAHFTPAVEIGWRLASQYWNQGYATEGAQACLEYGFNKVGLKEIVSFTVPANLASIKVMEKIGMKTNIKDNFAHPNIPENHPLSQHVLYRIKKS